MKSKLMAEDLTDVGPHWKQIVLQALTIEDMLAYFPPEDVLAQFTPKDVVARFKPKDLLAQFTPTDLLAHIKPEDIEIYENYLTQLKQSSRAATTKAKAKTKQRK